MGPAIVIGLEHNNLWLSHRGNLLKAAARHVRPGEAKELVPRAELFDMCSGPDIQPASPFMDQTPVGPAQHGTLPPGPAQYFVMRPSSQSAKRCRKSPKEETTAQPQPPEPPQEQQGQEQGQTPAELASNL